MLRQTVLVVYSIYYIQTIAPQFHHVKTITPPFTCKALLFLFSLIYIGGLSLSYLKSSTSNPFYNPLVRFIDS